MRKGAAALTEAWREARGLHPAHWAVRVPAVEAERRGEVGRVVVGPALPLHRLHRLHISRLERRAVGVVELRPRQPQRERRGERLVGRQELEAQATEQLERAVHRAARAVCRGAHRHRACPHATRSRQQAKGIAPLRCQSREPRRARADGAAGVVAHRDLGGRVFSCRQRRPDGQPQVLRQGPRRVRLRRGGIGSEGDDGWEGQGQGHGNGPRRHGRCG